MIDLGMGSDAHRVVVEFKEIRKDHAGLFATHHIAKGETAHTLTGRILSEPTRFSVQIDDGRHADEDGLVEYTNHSCTPSAYLDLSDPDAPRLRAIRDIALGGDVTIDYCASEDDMSSPFDCECGAEECYGAVRGYRWLTPAQRAALGERVSAFLVAKYADAPIHQRIEASGATETLSAKAV